VIFSQFSKETTQFFTIGLVPDPFTILEKKRWFSWHPFTQGSPDDEKDVH